MFGSRKLARAVCLVALTTVGAALVACAPLPASPPALPPSATASSAPVIATPSAPTAAPSATADVTPTAAPLAPRPTLAPPGLAALLARAARQGHVLVIVQLALPTGPFVPEGELSPAAVSAQRAAIASTRDALIEDLAGLDATVYATWDATPAVGLKVDEAALRALIASPRALSIQEDALSSTQ